MRMDLKTICQKVEATALTAKATAYPEQNQVVVTFTNRPDVQIALLTHYLQRQLENGRVGYDDLADLLKSVRCIANSENDEHHAIHGSTEASIVLGLDHASDIGRWGKMRLAYLEQHGMLDQTSLKTNVDIIQAMRQIDLAGDALFHQYLQIEKAKQAISDDLKVSDPLRWVVLMKKATSEAENQVIRQIIEC